jgi:hypothetical protein
MKTKTDIGFNQLFVDKEYKLIAGKGKKHSIFLSIVIGFSLMSLILSWQYYRDLKYQMSDPYVNYLALTVNDRIVNSFPDIIGLNDDVTFKEKYFIKDIYQFHKIWLDFQDSNEPDKFKWMIGLSMNTNQPLFKEILNQNCPGTEPELECKIVVTKKTISQLGLGLDRFLASTSITDFENNRLYPIGIHCSADRLPFKSDFIVSTGLGMSIEHNGTFNPRTTGTHFELLFQVFDRDIVITHQLVNDIFPDSVWQVLDISRLVNYEDYSAWNVHIVNLTSDVLSYNKFMQQLDSLSVSYPDNIAVKLNPISDFCDPSYTSTRLPDQIAFHFEKLDNLDSFVGFMEDSYQARFDMESIQTRNRMFQVSKLALAAISALIFLAGLIVLVYLGQLIIRHVEKSAHTLGMIKAFGLGAKELNFLYAMIIVRILGVSILVGLIPVFILCLTGSILLDGSLFLIVLVFIAVILFMGLLANRLFLHKLLNATPSDLINGRL